MQHTNNPSITAILNIFKRPHTLLEQLTALQNQSVQPENIIIWKNYAEEVLIPEIPIHLKKNVIIIESSKNFGVWARFTAGLLVNSKYVAVFDDDTIPGKDWFLNCIETMKTHEGLLGSIGLRFKKGNTYDFELPRIGWDGPNDETQQVDIVGHAWFFKQEWLPYLWECRPNYNEMFLCGEDIGFSYILQKYGINTYVPPHPLNNKHLWGSDYDKAFFYGIDKNAVSISEGIQEKFTNALQHYISLGFITMNNSNKYVDKMSLNGNMKQHLEQIINKIKNGVKFGLIRPSDGEYLILENYTFTNCDNWTNQSNSILRDQLMESIKIINPKLYIGIPCNSCEHYIPTIYEDYLNKYKVPKSQLTYANVFCNSNWITFVNFLKSCQGFYLITTGTLECDFPIVDRFYIDKYLVNNWNSIWELETNRILDYIQDKNDKLICFASGPIAKVLIPKCMNINPNNIYLDIGSILDSYTKGVQFARPYTDENHTNSKKSCNFI